MGFYSDYRMKFFYKKNGKAVDLKEKIKIDIGRTTQEELEIRFKKTHPESMRGTIPNCCGQPSGLGYGGE